MNPPANWYPDPTGRHGQRYWDGEQWTEHVFTDGVQGVDPLEGTAATADAAGGNAGDDAAESSSGAPTAADTADTAAGDTEDAADAEDHAADTADTAAGSAEPDEASGLFDAVGDEAVGGADVAPADAEATEQASDGGAAAPEPEWTPADDAASSTDDADVAPEVQADDVVGSLDEVAETAGTDPAAQADHDVPDLTEDDAGAEAAADAPADEEASDDEVDDEVATPAGDFSDAFMVTPETVSRLVSRQATAAPEAAQDDEPADDAPAADAAASPPSEAAADGTAASPAVEAEGAIDAPPPSMADAAPAAAPPAAAAEAGGGLGITGELVGGAFAEREESGPVALQNSRLLRCSLGGASGVIARQGTMVAYQGDVSFERQGAGGVTRALKRAATGEGLAMMRAEGTGDVFFADGAQHVFLLNLEGGPGLSVNGRNVLAFDAGLQWDIERVKGATLLAGGLFNTTLTGTGWVALVSDGEPVVLRTDEAPTFVDVNALVAWSSGLTTRITNTVSAKSLVGLGSGEAFQMAFEGSGIVIVQPSEGPMGGAAAS